MRGLDSIRMTTQLNALCRSSRLSVRAGDSGRSAPGIGERPTAPETAAAAILGPDVAHHLVDPDGVLDLDPWRATDLAAALPTLLAAEPAGWVLALPLPGWLGALRGPRPLNEAALETGEAVIATRAGVALVPYRIGPAVQWRVFHAELPRPQNTPAEADRALREHLISTGTNLARLDVSGGVRPPLLIDLPLPRYFDARHREIADRAARLLAICSAALTTDGASISSYEATARSVELRGLRDAALAALCAVVSWRQDDQLAD